MEQLVSAPPPGGSFGALLRAGRHRALLSQEQLAARAELSERTVRELEAGRVRSPRAGTVRLLADALQLSERERESWFAAARGVNHQRAGPAAPGAGGPAQARTDPRPSRHRVRGAPARAPIPGRRRWPAAKFPAGTLAPCRRDGRPGGQAAQDADLAPAAARARASQPGPDAGTRDDGLLTGAERRELAKLRRENRRLREHVEILTRATAIIATLTR
jgi:transcriptional regulator with XRE-family HTH domain